MMMAVLVDQVVNQIEAVTVETVDERQAGAVAVAEAHHPLCLERDDSGRQEAQQLRAIRPGLLDHSQRAMNPIRHAGRCRRDARGCPVPTIDKSGA